MTKLFRLSLLAFVALLGGQVRAQVTLAVHTVITTSNVENYTVASPLTFLLTTGSGPLTAGSLWPGDPNGMSWEDTSGTSPALWSNVTFDNVGGTWTRPASDAGYRAYSIVSIYEDGEFIFNSGAETNGDNGFAPTGLTIEGADIGNIYFSSTLTWPATPMESSVPDLNAYLAARAGNSYPAVNNYGAVMGTNGDIFFEFAITSVDIAAAPVPEPATWAAIAGAGALAFALIRRRARRA